MNDSQARFIVGRAFFFIGGEVMRGAKDRSAGDKFVPWAGQDKDTKCHAVQAMPHTLHGLVQEVLANLNIAAQSLDGLESSFDGAGPECGECPPQANPSGLAAMLQSAIIGSASVAKRLGELSAKAG